MVRIRDKFQDTDKAYEWLKKAADQGFAKAQGTLGSMYLTGNGVEKNYHEAFVFFDKASQQNDPQAQMALGYMYLKGKGVEKNLIKAKELLFNSCTNSCQEACIIYQKITNRYR